MIKTEKSVESGLLVYCKALILSSFMALAIFCFSACDKSASEEEQAETDNQSELSGDAEIEMASATASGPFAEKIQPLWKNYCITCHDKKGKTAGVDLQSIHGPEHFQTHPALMDRLIKVLSDKSMPPEYMSQPTAEEYATMLAWVKGIRDEQAQKMAGDPGPVTMPRLNHNEYNYVIRDLTGVDLKASRYFSKDGGSGEGFSNVGAALSVTPVHIEKYLDAAEMVLSHARITPERGLMWSEQVQRPLPSPLQYRVAMRDDWMIWHQNQLGDAPYSAGKMKNATGMTHGAYMHALWQYKHREELGIEVDSLDEWARNYLFPLSPKTTKAWWKMLHDDSLSRFLDDIKAAWQALPAPSDTTKEGILKECKKLDELIDTYIRRVGGPYRVQPYYEERFGKGGSKERQAWNRDVEQRALYAYDISAGGRNPLYAVTTDAGDGSEGDIVIWKNAYVVYDDDSTETLAASGAEFKAVMGDKPEFGKHPKGDKIDANSFVTTPPSIFELTLPEKVKRFFVDTQVDKKYGEKTGSVQTIMWDEPQEDADFIPGRAVYGWPDSEKMQAFNDAKDKLSSFFSVNHYAFNNTPIRILQDYEGVDLKYLDTELPEDVKPLGSEPDRPHWRSPEDLRREASEEDMDYLKAIEGDMRLTAQVPWQDLHDFLKEAGAEDLPEGVLPGDDFVQGLSGEQKTRYLELVQEAEKLEVELAKRARGILNDFVPRAWRRQISDEEMNRLMDYYREGRESGKNFEDSLKMPMQVALVSPYFLFRVWRSRSGEDAHRISDWELANRLSFCLWASAPDDELLQLAEENKLHEPEVLKAQARRMLQDERARALASEFATHWLEVADFETYVSPDAERFPQFDEDIAESMQEESIQFFLHIFRKDKPITDILFADYVLVNEDLAEIYGIEGVEGDHFRLVKVHDGVRGGVLGMGSVLTATSMPLRTSPVLRGHWLLNAILGTPVPEPPPDVPMLSDDERSTAGLTIAEQLARHRADPACSSCHERMDPLGLAMEKLDPIGRFREKDLAGEPVLDLGTNKAGLRLEGLAGLRDYLKEKQDLFLRNFCKRFLGYALGRPVLPSDESLLEEMQQALKENDYAFTALLDTVIMSKQFQYRRDVDPELAEKLAIGGEE
ncbi:MAG: DUF1592 domain-containing protein [bacterium]